MKAWACGIGASAVLLTSNGLAATRTPGADAVEATFDFEAGALAFARCRGASCDAPKRLAIPIERGRLDRATAKIDVVAIGDGKHVLHARVADVQRKDLAFEAVLAPQDEPVFAGLTGFVRGEDGDRSGEIVLVDDRDDTSKFVLVAETREDTRICGQAVTPLATRGLDPKTMQLRGATRQRLEKAARDAATPLEAKEVAGKTRAPLAHLLDATGGSAPGARALTDGAADTWWSEKRPGDGHGEFVTMRAPAEVPLHGIDLTLAPPSLPKGGAAPRTLFVATDARIFRITLPGDAWAKPGQAYAVTFDQPLKTTCLAVVLDEASAAGIAAPEVMIAEASAVSAFDAERASLDDVARALSGPRAEEAAALLKRASEPGLAAVTRRFPELDAPARALAVDVAASAGTCDGPAMELLTGALADKDAEVKKRALGRVERCGKQAAPALVRAVRGADEARRASAAPLLAAIAPSAGTPALGEVLGQGSNETRRAVRSAFARASIGTSRDVLLGFLANKELPRAARMDLLRALGPKLPELRPEADAVIADLLRAAPDMATRWLLVQPLAQLARENPTEGELTRLAELARRDPEWPVRARAVELSAGIAPLAPTVAAAASDPEPRVREAALRANALAKSAPDLATKALRDRWTFVRVAATEALAASPHGAPGLATALEDDSPKVRSAALAGLAHLRATPQAKKVRERLDDEGEDLEVRALAARTLGALCARDATDRLTKLAQRARTPADEADDRLGMAAIDALSALHPADLEKRLAPLRTKDTRTPVKRAADRALSEAGTCR